VTDFTSPPGVVKVPSATRCVPQHVQCVPLRNDAGGVPWSRAPMTVIPLQGSGGAGGGEPEVSELVRRAAAGDREAFRDLVERYGPFVTQVARRFSCCAADADDVAQEVWCTLWAHLDRIESPELLHAWLRRVTTNRAFRVQARTVRLVPGWDAGEQPGTDQTEEVGLRRTGRAETHSAVHEALARLKAADRQLVELLMVQDRPDYRSVSRVVNRPVGSIGPTRQRIFERLRRDPDIGRAYEALLAG
jgi:RNA polymerase sigma factor (sigma-70 family)